MARPIVPQGVRRLADGGPVEVLGKSGRWVPFSVLGDAGREAVLIKYASRMQSGRFPAERFDWGTEAKHEQQQDWDPQKRAQEYQQHYQQDQQQDQDQDQQDEGQDNMEQQDQQQDQQRPLTMEELVRQIAGELDVQATTNTLAYVNDLLADFQPKGGDGEGGLVPIITRVEVRKVEQLEQHDGLFHHQFPDLLAMAAIGQHTYLPGPPGSGKSHAGEQVADALGWKYVDISLSQDMPESRIWGGRTADGGFVETPVLDAIRWACENPDSGAIVLFDEMDAARPGLLTSINSTLANRKVTAPNGDMLRFGDNLTFLGAANTYGTGPTAEFPGRFKIDPATIDRFTYLPWDTDVAMETAVVHSFLHDGDVARAWLDVWHTLRSNVATYGLKFFVTMRGARNGARMIASGFPMDKTLMLVAGNKIPADQWAKVNPL